MTTELPEKSSDYRSEELHLKEALRLAELMMVEQKSFLTAIEQKAVLLATLCVGVTAFLFSQELPHDGMAARVSLVFIISWNIAAAFCAAAVAFDAPFSAPGADPEYSLQERFRGNFSKMAIDLLGRYESQRINYNNKVLAKKTKQLELSLWLGVMGISFACGWIIYYQYGMP